MKTIVNELRAELRAAHGIIRNALGVATFDQKIAWGNANERDGVIGEGVTRAHERQEAIDSDSGAAIHVELYRAHRIIENAADLLSAHQRELWFVSNRQEGACVSLADPARQTSRGDLLDRVSVFDMLTLPQDGAPDGEGPFPSALSEGVIGVDMGRKGDDETAAALSPVVKFSERDMAEIRRALSESCNARSMLLLPAFDMHAFLRRQRAFSARTFGPGRLTARVCDHIRKELTEVEAAPDDLREWIDVILLGLDGAWRTGATPEQITAALAAKLTTNEGRVWPDWRTCDPDRAIEHVEHASKGGQV
ncbi:dATP/dGTP pyrophosphohydrolase domain-containing protein [Burkholderia ambifaria]|uniref:dATP/dGTP pyrophosphohydrolase domain-containing protein n=1 Tax=Burkholderia ambifaria TaxID=152480 RepID=UPI00158E3889|nr:dATP/dGTP pyrophosphohydrolase domain-containing protein [Burkholderia ambifaria]